MPYHARFGHAADPAWIARQVAWLGRHLGVEGRPGERTEDLADRAALRLGRGGTSAQVREVLDHGTRPPATGVMVFLWGTLYPQWEKVEEMGEFYRSIEP